MKMLKTKIIIYIFIIFFLFIDSVFATTNSWDFSTPWEYTISNSKIISIDWWIASIKQNILIHNWAYDVVMNWDTNSPSLTTNTAYNYWTNNIITSFTETLWIWNQWIITYQVSKNNWTTWYYWNGRSWSKTIWWVANSNSAIVMNSNLPSFNYLAWWSWLLSFKIFFTSNWKQKVELDNINIVSIESPSPGWVSNNLAFWLKANEWTSTTTNWTSLTKWNDQSGNWLNATAWIGPTYYNTTTNLNFYPLIDFNGSTQYLQNTSSWAYSQSYFTVLVPDNQVDGTLMGWVPFGINCVDEALNSWKCWLPFWWLVLWEFTISANNEIITHSIWSSNNWRSSHIWTNSYDTWKPMLISINENVWGTWTEISEKWILINNYNANSYKTLSATSYRLWMSTDSVNPYPYNWKIAEIINFSTRTSPTDKLKIESYLSLKYWITLKNGTSNYIASDWITNMWNTTIAGTYTYDIFWIWRDDKSKLAQVKSKSVNSDEIITLEAIWEWTNMSSSFVDINDKEFLSISNNNLWNMWTKNDSPIWYYSLARRWKVQETWELWKIKLDFDLSNPYFNIPLTSTWTNYYFTYDNNWNGLLADEKPKIMRNLWWDIWWIWWININNNSIFTISTQAISNNIPNDFTLSNNNINDTYKSISTTKDFEIPQKNTVTSWIITNINFSSGTLLPWWNHTININYFDTGSIINTSSDIISLNKWNWTTWWSDISPTWLNLWWKIITSSWSSYTTNNLIYWKYRYNFQISDNIWNIYSTWAVFYIDEPELIISSWSLDIWDIKNNITKFSSSELMVTVKTVWAWFDLLLNKDSSISEWTAIITDWNWVNWFWYDELPYTSTIHFINTNEILATQAWSIDTNGYKNTYIYLINFWAIIWSEQIAWYYEWLIKYWLILNY